MHEGKVEEAKAEYAQSHELEQQSSVPDTAKKNFELGNRGSLALVDSAKRDFENAKREAEAMRTGFEALSNPNQVRAAHEVLGTRASLIRYASGNHFGAVKESTATRNDASSKCA